MSTPPALVIGADFNGLSVIQTLGAHGVECWACDTHRNVGAHSRYARFWGIPDPKHDEEGMVQRILELARHLGRQPVIIPTWDHFAQALARHRPRFEGIAIPCVSDADVMDLVLDKNRFAAWTQAQGLSSPRAVAATEFSAAGPLSFPVVAKPLRRGIPNGGAATPASQKSPDRYTLIRDVGEWESFRQRKQADLPRLLVQELVHGTTADIYGVCLYANRRSDIKGLFVGRKIRGWPALYGNARAVQSDKVPDDVLAEVARIVEAIGFFGIGQFEYKRDSVSGGYHLLDINARCWGWIGVTSGTEADIPWIAYQDLSGTSVRSVQYTGRPGSVKYVRLMEDLVNVLLRYRWNHPAWVLSPRQWWRSLRAERLIVAEWNRGDWRGSAWSVLFFFKRALQLARRRIRTRFS